MPWASGDTLDSATLNLRGASASSNTGFSTNTIRKESGTDLVFVGANFDNVLPTGLINFGSAVSRWRDAHLTSAYVGNIFAPGGTGTVNLGIQAFDTIYLIAPRQNAASGVTAKSSRLQFQSAAWDGSAQSYQEFTLELTSLQTGPLRGQLQVLDGSGATIFGIRRDSIVISNTSSPTGLSSGVTGQLAWDASFIYVCTSTNSWRRATLAAF